MYFLTSASLKNSRGRNRQPEAPEDPLGGTQPDQGLRGPGDPRRHARGALDLVQRHREDEGGRGAAQPPGPLHVQQSRQGVERVRQAPGDAVPPGPPVHRQSHHRGP